MTIEKDAIVIEDTGIGISKDIKDKVFERFFREDHPGAKPPGEGIGLFLVRELCDVYGWQVSINQVAGGAGARVIFSWL